MNEINKTDATLEKQKKTGRGGLIKAVKTAFNEGLARRRAEKEAPLIDVLSFVIAFLFGSRHMIFGSYPLGIAFIAVLPARVWIAALGSALGALTLGKAGIIYSMISTIVVFLRVIVSGTDTKENQKEEAVPLFSESLILRMSAALIGGFIAAVYETLLSGFTLASVAFGLSMVLLPPLVTFAFSGLFGSGIRARELIFGTSSVFDAERRNEKEKFNLIFFQFSSLIIIFFISLALHRFTLLGISASYVFSTVAALFTAKRFGPLRAAAVGFVSCLGVSSTLAVSFALGGLAAGLLSGLGAIYSVLGLGIAVFAWSAYSAGLGGVLTVLPEFCIGVTLSAPILKKAGSFVPRERVERSERTASEIAGTLSLAYRSRYSGSLDALEGSLSSISSSVKRYMREASSPSAPEAKELICECINRYCEGCGGYSGCLNSGAPLPCATDALAELLYKNGHVTSSEIDTLPSFCANGDKIAEAINRAWAILSEENYKLLSKNSSAEDLSLISKLINEARLKDEREKAPDEELAERLKTVLDECGLSEGTVRVLGDRRKHFIVAARDREGKTISSAELKENIEKACGLRLGKSEYYKKEETALMECSVTEAYEAEFAFASAPGGKSSVSGDVAASFVTRDKHFFALISDGMGSGEEARETSSFVLDFMKKALELGAGRETSLMLLNNVIKRQRRECSATLDLFSFDLINGSASFIKSGAAPSYVRRESSIFRIRSKTAPMGLLAEVDAERIKVDCQVGDYIVMTSDGVSSGIEDSAWLPQLLAGGPKGTLKEFAETILAGALKENGSLDDMTVAVVHIRSRAKGA